MAYTVLKVNSDLVYVFLSAPLLSRPAFCLLAANQANLPS